MQLDIFEHSRDTMLRNDVLHALQRREPVLARHALTALTDEFPRDTSRGALDRLVAELEQPPAPAFADHAAAQAALRALREDIAPVAQQLLGARESIAWLAPLWRQLAQRASRLAFVLEHSQTHAAVLLLHAGEFDAAAAQVERIESWRRIPAPLSWMAEARWHLQGLDACWGMLAELAWMAPERFDQLTRRLDDPLLLRLRRQFDAAFDGDGTISDLAWFPAWLLTEKPALAAAMGTAQPGTQDAPERALRLLLDLLHLERQGRQRELLAQRRALRDLNAPVYAAYMRTR